MPIWVRNLTQSDTMVYQGILGSHRIDIETGGFVSFDAQPTNSPHRHDYFEVCLALSGTGRYVHGGRSFRLQRGSVFLAEPGVVHEISSFETCDLRLYFLVLSLQRLDAPGIAPPHPILQRFDHGRATLSEGHEQLEAYVRLVEGSDPGDADLRREVLRLFALELIDVLAEPIPLSETVGVHDELAAATAAIDRWSDTGASVETIAREVGVSSRTLRRRFAKSGLRPSDEINHRRMRKAAHRLLMGFTVQEAAEHVGISSPAQFTRAFKRAFGLAPKKFQLTYMPGNLARTTRPPDDLEP